jgi:autotransporter-associated beta strand protein
LYSVAYLAEVEIDQPLSSWLRPTGVLLKLNKPIMKQIIISIIISIFAGLATSSPALVAETHSITCSIIPQPAKVEMKQGSFSLTGANTYSGRTIVNSGTLNIGGADDGSSRVGSITLTINSRAMVKTVATLAHAVPR